MSERDKFPYRQIRPYMGVTERMMRKLDDDIGDLREGLDPENLAHWYDRIISRTVETAPPWLADKVRVRQDPILTMRFNLDISKRAVGYFMMAIDDYMDEMPYSTRLYFLKIQGMMEDEVDKSLV